jgi:hypothetical protein
MRLTLVSVAVLAIMAGFGGAHAQSSNDFSGPREAPPASFSGQQYVDSRGCVFLRAGLAGRTNWVPRVSRDRAPLCGYPPTFGANQVAIVDPVPERAPVAATPTVTARPQAPAPTTRRPMDTIASTTAAPRIRQAPPRNRVDARSYAPAPVAVAPARRVAVQPPAAPQTRAQPAERVATVPTGGKIGCYTDAPVAERFRVHGGGTMVMCTRGDGNLDTARPPRVLEGVAAIAQSGYLERPAPVTRGQADGARVVISSQDYRDPPKGFKRAWEDDRLNPNRAIGTRTGWEAQDQVWTRETPARLVEDAEKPRGKRVIVRKVYASSKSEPSDAAAPKAATGRLYVQVGTFGVAANAEGASARLSQLGLPVARSRAQRNGATLQTVLAGPFASQTQARAALSAARKAGFGDAFLR